MAATPELEFRERVTLDEIPKEGQRLLLEYSGLTKDDLLPHVLEIVRQARPTFGLPYPS